MWTPSKGKGFCHEINACFEDGCRRLRVRAGDGRRRGLLLGIVLERKQRFGQRLGIGRELSRFDAISRELSRLGVCCERLI